jgi:hypothetical protein
MGSGDVEFATSVVAVDIMMTTNVATNAMGLDDQSAANAEELESI